MFCRRGRTILNIHQIFNPNSYKENLTATTELKHCACALYSTGLGLVELPRKLKNCERKPWVTNINEVKRRARLEKQEKRVVREVALKPPENGLLVNELIPVAHHVLTARTRLLYCASRVAESIPIHICSVCGDVHVGDPPHKIRTCNVSGSQKSKDHSWERGGVDHVLPVVESYHLYDRLGRAVSHNERLEVDRIPAIVELCIQAGVDVPEYPTRRREFPVYRVAGRVIDFEKKFPKHDLSGNGIKAIGFWDTTKRSNINKNSLNFTDKDLKGFAEQGMEAYEKLRIGIVKLMQKYPVQTCGHCSEVQVGPKGHRVRQCQAFKHQMRDGQHAWQEATFDDLFLPIYVWHVMDTHQTPLIDALKRYYGMLPAVIELFAQAGAKVGENYWAVMREDVVVPRLNEEKLVV